MSKKFWAVPIVECRKVVQVFMFEKRVKQWEIHLRNVRRAENVGAFRTLRLLSKGNRRTHSLNSSEKLLLCKPSWRTFLRQWKFAEKMFAQERFWFQPCSVFPARTSTKFSQELNPKNNKFLVVIKNKIPMDINHKFINLMVVRAAEWEIVQRAINKHNGSERYYDKLWE